MTAEADQVQPRVVPVVFPLVRKSRSPRSARVRTSPLPSSSGRPATPGPVHWWPPCTPTGCASWRRWCRRQPGGTMTAFPPPDRRWSLTPGRQAGPRRDRSRRAGSALRPATSARTRPCPVPRRRAVPRRAGPRAGGTAGTRRPCGGRTGRQACRRRGRNAASGPSPARWTPAEAHRPRRRRRRSWTVRPVRQARSRSPLRGRRRASRAVPAARAGGRKTARAARAGAP